MINSVYPKMLSKQQSPVLNHILCLFKSVIMGNMEQGETQVSGLPETSVLPEDSTVCCPLKMPATETGEMLGKTTFRTRPRSPKNPQQPFSQKFEKAGGHGHWRILELVV